MLKINTKDVDTIGKINFSIERDGKVVDGWQVNNLVVERGKNLLANFLAGRVANPPRFIAVGRDSTKSRADNTSLGVEVFRTGLSNVDVDRNIVTYYAVIPSGIASGIISEVGLFDDENTGRMFARATFPPYTKKIEDQLVIVWSITLG